MKFDNVAVVILNYNNKTFLEKFLPLVIRFSGDASVIIADNGSSDDSLLFVRSNFPTVKIIENGGNFGYATGYNLALKKIDWEYYVLLNSDVEVTENWLDSVMELFASDPMIAAIQPKLLDYNNRTRFEYAGACGGFIDTLGYPFCRGRIFNTIEEDKGQYNDATEVFWATGACMAVKGSVFHKAGGFDDNYFAHMEEIDLCWRIKNLGYKIFVQPASVVYHVGGGTLNKISPRKTFLNFRNNLSTFTRNHRGGSLFPKIIFRMVLDGIAALKFLAEGEPSHFAAVIKAHFNYYSWLPRILKNRRWLMTQSSRTAQQSPQIYKGNIVADYFMRGKRKFSDLPASAFSSR